MFNVSATMVFEPRRYPQNLTFGCGRMLGKVAVAAAALLALQGAVAQSNPYQRGPNPTTASLEASAGPYAVANTKITAPVNYGGGTVYYPTSTSDGPFGVVVFAPGFTNTEASNSWWGPRLASHGFVVIMMNTLTLFDLPGLRSYEELQALKDIVARSQTSGSPYFGKIDPTRRAVMGHSMGGGGTLQATLADPTLRAAIPLAPWNTAKVDYSKSVVPTMVMAGQNDTLAVTATMAAVFYDSLPDAVDQAYVEFKGAGHTFPNNSGPAAMKPIMAKYAVSWLKRFVDDDTRYSTFLCGAPHQADLSSTTTVISAYKENCPY